MGWRGSHRTQHRPFGRLDGWPVLVRVVQPGDGQILHRGIFLHGLVPVAMENARRRDNHVSSCPRCRCERSSVIDIEQLRWQRRRKICRRSIWIESVPLYVDLGRLLARNMPLNSTLRSLRDIRFQSRTNRWQRIRVTLLQQTVVKSSMISFCIRFSAGSFHNNCCIDIC